MKITQSANKNVHQNPLVDRSNILPTLCIKVWLMKNFVKWMNQERETFNCLRENFRHVTDTKVKEGIFVSLQFRELLTEKNL